MFDVQTNYPITKLYIFYVRGNSLQTQLIGVLIKSLDAVSERVTSHFKYASLTSYAISRTFSFSALVMKKVVYS